MITDLSKLFDEYDMISKRLSQQMANIKVPGCFKSIQIVPSIPKFLTIHCSDTSIRDTHMIYNGRHGHIDFYDWNQSLDFINKGLYFIGSIEIDGKFYNRNAGVNKIKRMIKLENFK